MRFQEAKWYVVGRFFAHTLNVTCIPPQHIPGPLFGSLTSERLAVMNKEVRRDNSLHFVYTADENFS